MGMTTEQKLIAAALRWQGERAKVRRLRLERSAFFCARAEPVSPADYEDAHAEAKSDPLATFEFPQPTQDAACWKAYVDGPEDRYLRPQSEWCEQCRRRQAVHEQYREATRAHGAAMRAVEQLARSVERSKVPA